MFKKLDIDWGLVQGFLALTVIIVIGLLVARPIAPIPDVIIPFPEEVPEDLYGTYWLLLKGSSGVNLPGYHFQFTSPSDPTWVRKEAMWVDPEFLYEWTWEHNGEVRLKILGKPGICYKIGPQTLEVDIKKDAPYWAYSVDDCRSGIK